jgi:hypothetical protein
VSEPGKQAEPQHHGEYNYRAFRLLMALATLIIALTILGSFFYLVFL